MSASKRRLPRLLTSLSARLLVLTIFFVMLAEFLIYAPSIGRYRKVYLEDRIARAHLAMLALDSLPDIALGRDLENDLLFHTDTYGIVLNRPDRRMLVVHKEMPPEVDVTFDLKSGMFVSWIRDAFVALGQETNRVMRVVGMSPKDATVTVEVVMDETPMREAMYDYSGRILTLSIAISLFTAGLVYVSLQWLLVRPMRRITESMVIFREDPEDVSRTIRPSDRNDEIGVAQRQLAVMQEEVRAALKQKTRLATLGAAVAKINHDLRNSLATAVLVSDRLADIDDPEVKRVTPRLYHAIDRAVTLCSQTLNYVVDVTPTLEASRFRLHDLVDEVAVALSSPDGVGAELDIGAFDLDNDVDAELQVEADREQLFRVLSNLEQNALQAGAGLIRVAGGREDGRILIDVSDDGPGLPPRAREKLFQPFAGSARDGGTGLGLVIAKDIMRAHGGDLKLMSTGTDGTTFRIELPARLRSWAGAAEDRDDVRVRG